MSQKTLIGIFRQVKRQLCRFFTLKRADDFVVDDILLIEVLLGEILGDSPITRINKIPKDLDEMMYLHARKFMVDFFKYKNTLGLRINPSSLKMVEAMVKKILDHFPSLLDEEIPEEPDDCVCPVSNSMNATLQGNVARKPKRTKKKAQKKKKQKKTDVNQQCPERLNLPSSSPNELIFPDPLPNIFQAPVHVPDTIERYYRRLEAPGAQQPSVCPPTKTWLKKRKTYSRCPPSSDSDCYSDGSLGSPQSGQRRRSDRLRQKPIIIRLVHK